MNATHELRPPRRGLLLLESRAAIDALGVVPSLLASFRPWRQGPADTGELVMVVPGFGSGDSYTLPLRRYLRNLGMQVEGWGMGVNLGGTDISHSLEDLSERWSFETRDEYQGEAGVPLLIDRLCDRVLQRHRETGRPVALVGWSLGGYLAREVARELPDAVCRVVTMGSPIIGGPKYTAIAGLFQRRGQDLDWIEREIIEREKRPIHQPITAIYSKSDGIVHWRAAVDRVSPRVKNLEIDGAHLGMGFNRRYWRPVASALRAGHAPMQHP